VLLAKPNIDSKGESAIVSRLGVERSVDFLIAPEENLRLEFTLCRNEHNSRSNAPISCLLIDEAQFLTREQVNQALEIATLDDIPVLAYGLRTDFQTAGFPGSIRLLEIAHSLEELKTICRCGKKAMFNARKVGGNFIFDGAQVAIDGDSVTYESLCTTCYFREREAAGAGPL
ncbi:MAG: thymidine kinase, partial [Microbacteriaceae bacterium]|nr:thymidine kinase [Microbacteriaceae bacterium]